MTKEMGNVNQPSETDSDSTSSTPILLTVYRDLRVGLAVTMAMLAAAIVIDVIQKKGCVQGALSEYFYTPAHSVFIATLIGFATLFFVYRGSSGTEDALLTLAGVAALIAALVPQGRPELCAPSFVPEAFKTEVIVRPNVWSVVVALILGWSVTWWKNRPNRREQTRSAGATLALYFLRLVVAVGLLSLIFRKDWFFIHAHGAAGVLMLSAFIATVFTTAHLAKKEDRSTKRRDYRGFYTWIARLMLVTLIGVITVHVTRPDWFRVPWVSVLEAALILEFLAYWVVQSIELWDTPDRTERLSQADRERLAHRPTQNGFAELISEIREVMAAPAGQKLTTFL
jgi:hypothetical protein